MTASGWLQSAGILLLIVATTSAQATRQPQRRSHTPLERAVLEALAVDPATAPYPIATDIRDGKLVVSGRVATSAIHDLVIQTALAYTPSVRDDLVIDTAEVGRALAGPAQGPAQPSGGGAGAAAAGVASFPSASTYSSPPYYYPPPLFGRLDEPFYGFEPPVISYPPWWGGLSNQRLAEWQQANTVAAVPEQAAVPTSAPPGQTTRTLDLDVDAAGVATVRGAVQSEEQRRAIEEQLRANPGITRVINELQVAPEADRPPLPAAPRAAPPRPPEPGLPATPKIEAAPAAPAVAPKPRAEATARVEMRNGVAYLEGSVPTLTDAMQIYLAAVRAPGVRGVEDRLVVALPNDRVANPLLLEPNREDVAQYLLAQIRRHVGDRATIDRVDLNGARLSVFGRARDEAARDRVEAALRSMAVLRGFELVPSISAQGRDA